MHQGILSVRKENQKGMQYLQVDYDWRKVVLITPAECWGFYPTLARPILPNRDFGTFNIAKLINKEHPGRVFTKCRAKKIIRVIMVC